MAVTNPILAGGKCHVCEHHGRSGVIDIKRNRNGRLYSHCRNPECRTEIRYEIDGGYEPHEVPGYLGKSTPNVNRPVVANDPEPEQANDNVNVKDGGSDAGVSEQENAGSGIIIQW